MSTLDKSKIKANAERKKSKTKTQTAAAPEPTEIKSLVFLCIRKLFRFSLGPEYGMRAQRIAARNKLLR